MLGAQALRTKQKAEQKEKEKRQRERLRSLELQRDKLHKAACEDAAAQYLEITANPPLKGTKHRHSLHTSNVQQLHITAPTFDKSARSNGQFLKNMQSVPRSSSSSSVIARHGNWPRAPSASSLSNTLAAANGPQRSTSSDYCRDERRDTISNSSRFLKWLGIGSNTAADKKDLKNRRMSTFT
ncbi:hypothetical protein Q1695_013893 [Nippostrongylus brasiliensis]|nr:hypothetical protein Q1695_013893 [Nippostrongylus brasiliensis]